MFLRQQPAALPPVPQVLVMSDQMLEDAQQGDKYLKVLAMVGYTSSNYTQDVRDGFVQVLQYPYIVVFLGTMQLGIFDSRQVQKQVFELMKAITEVNPCSHVVFSGLIPRPIDFHRSRMRCENYSRSYKVAVEEYRVKYGWNCGFLSVFKEFLKDDKILDTSKYFIEDLYLSAEGIRILRAASLRHLGFFPKKA